MKLLKVFFILILSIILVGCDPTHSVDYMIENQTSGSISLQTRHRFQDSSDLNIIGTGSKVVIFSDFGIGRTTNKYLDGLKSTPLIEIIISLDDSLSFTKDPLAIDHWKKIYPGDNSRIGKVILTVFDEDFE